MLGRVFYITGYVGRPHAWKIFNRKCRALLSRNSTRRPGKRYLSPRVAGAPEGRMIDFAPTPSAQ
jgi:hypothetical protein